DAVKALDDKQDVKGGKGAKSEWPSSGDASVGSEREAERLLTKSQVKEVAEEFKSDRMTACDDIRPGVRFARAICYLFRHAEHHITVTTATKMFGMSENSSSPYLRRFA